VFRVSVKSVKLRERLMRERVVGIDREHLLERGFAVGIALGGEFEDAEADAQIERPWRGLRVSLQEIDRLIRSFGVAEMFGRGAGERRVFRMGVEREKEAAVDLRLAGGVVILGCKLRESVAKSIADSGSSGWSCASNASPRERSSGNKRRMISG
jgi:hypothetical protein